MATVEELEKRINKAAEQFAEMRKRLHAAEAKAEQALEQARKARFNERQAWLRAAEGQRAATDAIEELNALKDLLKEKKVL